MKLQNIESIVKLLSEHHVIGISDGFWCEVTKPGDDGVYFEVPINLVKRLLVHTHKPMTDGYKLLLMWLEEPNCAPRLSLFSESNREALMYQIPSAVAETKLLMSKLMNDD
jgi:hypothetical protein